jgi:hypothetical protein
MWPGAGREPLSLIELLARGGENECLAAVAANHDFVVSCSQHHIIPDLRANPETLSLLITYVMQAEPAITSSGQTTFRLSFPLLICANRLRAVFCKSITATFQLQSVGSLVV